MESYEQVKQQLLSLRDEYTRRISAIELETHHKNEPVEKDFAEQATQSENNDVLAALDNEAQHMVMQVDAALNAIEKGHYGICKECGEQIPQARLNAAPFSHLCIQCAEHST